MSKWLKYLFSTGGIALLIMGYADNRSGYNYPARNIDNDDKGKRATKQQEMMQDRPITPDAGPKVTRGADVILSMDIIYWNIREDGLAFAETGTTSSNQVPAINATEGSVHHVDFDWEPGFKIGVGVDLTYDGWDVFAQYTWIRSNPGTRIVAKDPPIIDATNNIKASWDVMGFSALTQDLLFASGKWKLHFNVLDVELGRNFYISKFLTMRPHVGLKGTWQDDNLTIRYRWEEGQLIRQTKMKNNVDYWGFGVRVGMNNAWYFFRNLCLFGDFAISGLWSKFDIDRKDFVTPNFTSAPTTILTGRNTENEVHSLKAVLELTMGLRYDIWWNEDNYHFGVQAGWEEQLWFSHNQHYKQLEEAAHGDLCLQGLTIKARFDF